MERKEEMQKHTLERRSEASIVPSRSEVMKRSSAPCRRKYIIIKANLAN